MLAVVPWNDRGTVLRPPAFADELRNLATAFDSWPELKAVKNAARAYSGTRPDLPAGCVIAIADIDTCDKGRCETTLSCANVEIAERVTCFGR